MVGLILDLDAISEACRRFDVQRLDLFGSGTAAAYDPQHSDVDLLVTFRTNDWRGRSDRYFGLLEALQRISGGKVDLLEDGAVQNPYFREEIGRSRTQLFPHP